MNDKQKKIAIGTGFGTLAAEFLVGTLGVGLLGTAVAVPAAAVVATTGTLAYFAAGDSEDWTPSSPDQVTDKVLGRMMTKELIKAIFNKPAEKATESSTETVSKKTYPNTPDPDVKSFILKKGTITHKITVNNVRDIAYACLQATSAASWTNYQYFNNIQEGRDFYKTLLAKGYQPA